ncbi:MAG: hypothetical protein CTY34_09510 [Methylobacter sp.]|nr:MAG: hypothetical protein CTY34_09510 [Methylobacter sp.]PPD36060.1 MAG: hypothetical protein CTY18_05725 [Methylomonas sp.]
MSVLCGCVSPIALDKAVIEYDKTTANLVSKQLLLNIARAHQQQPIHFTGVSNIAATFNFQLNAGATPALTGNNGALLAPLFGGSIAENPTITIVPIEGEEFTRRLLTPIYESKLTMLLRQGTDVDLILRLLAAELRLSEKHTEVYANNPGDMAGYSLFRQAVLHLSAIQDQGQLYAEPMIFETTLELPAESVGPEQLANLQKDYEIEYSSERKSVKLVKNQIGRIVITNYDPASLTNQDRKRLHDEANERADNDVLVDIRSGFEGGEWPLHGVFRLRSFHNVLNFIGQSLDRSKEFPVQKHFKTPAVRENPDSSLGIMVTAWEPEDSELSVRHNGQYYWLKPETGYQWNREGFRLLYQVFQMTVSELGTKGAPVITIAK